MATTLKNLSSYNPEEIPSHPDKLFGIVVSDWNHSITNNLLEGVKEALALGGVPPSNIYVTRVPGSFELPFGAQRLMDEIKPHAVICLGCVIQGETRHFDFICQAVATGIMDLSLHSRLPVVFGVLTCNTEEQAKDRSGGKHGNKGFEAGVTALKLI